MSRDGAELTCEVLVVGGGPAGSSLARCLHPAGVDVVVIDRARFPRDKTCAGWITPAVLELLGLDVERYRRDNVLQPIHGFRVGMRRGAVVTTRRRDQPISFGIRRCEFDDCLLRRSGARVRLGEPVTDLRRVGRGWRIDGRISARLIVGAGGHFCPVARALGGVPARAEARVLAQEVEFRMSPGQARACPVDPEIPEIYFCRDLRGYGWIFRKGDFINVGLGREDPRGLSRHLKDFVAEIAARGRVPFGLPRRARGHAYLLHPRSSRAPFGEGFLLVGDALGLAYPRSGEGIRPAIESSLLAARTILAARGDYRKETLADYGRRVIERFGQRPPRAELTGLLPSALLRGAARRLLSSEWFTRRIVLDRWFLQANLPPLGALDSGRARLP